MKYDIKLKYSPELLRGFDRLKKEHLLRAAKQQILELREQAAQGGRKMVVARPHLFKKIKKDIARIKTILREGGW